MLPLHIVLYVRIPLECSCSLRVPACLAYPRLLLLRLPLLFLSTSSSVPVFFALLYDDILVCTITRISLCYDAQNLRVERHCRSSKSLLAVRRLCLSCRVSPASCPRLCSHAPICSPSRASLELADNLVKCIAQYSLLSDL